MIDRKALAKALAAYRDATRAFGAAKVTRDFTLARLEAERKQALAAYSEAFAVYVAAGEALSKFTDDDPDPDEDEDAD
jgi:hypothetical protein